MSTSPFVFAVGNDIFVSPNVQRPPTTAELQQLDAQFSDPLMPTDALHLRYADNRFPYIGFTMPHAHYNSTILQPLHHSEATLPICMLGGQYCLTPALVASWDELELNLRTLASKLLSRFRPLMPPYYEVFPFPGDYGYARGRHTANGMRRAGMRARKAFAPLMAYCSFAIAMTPNFMNSAPEWVDYLGKNGAHPRWLQEFIRTPIGDFSTQTGRIGCVIRPKPVCQFLEHIPKFVQANVPVWLVWSDENNYHKTHCARYKPSREAVQAARILAKHGPVREPMINDMLPASPPPVLTALEQPPVPESGSGQRKGETLDEFMARRAERHAFQVQTETPLDHQRRMQRITSAERYPLPGKSGARVFEWELEGNYWIRKSMPRKYVEQIWTDIPPGHLRYDSFANEWDYCESFDPSAQPPTEEDYDELEQAYLIGTHTIDVDSTETPQACSGADAQVVRHATLGIRNLEQAYVPAAQRGVFTPPETLEVILASRYGFSVPVGYPTSDMTANASSSDVTTNESSWIFVRKTLSDIESQWEWPHWQHAVGTFVLHAIANTMPPELWDIDPHSPSPIGFFNDHLVVERVTNRARVLYRLVPRLPPDNETLDWDLLVPDAITALECIRRSHVSLGKAELVRFFLQTGRPFSTRMPIDPAPPPPLVPRIGRYYCSGLGERSAGYNPDLLDYMGYERDRTHFLMSDRARAVMEEGGIVWRLGIEHLNYDDVVGGPVDVAAGLYERFDGEPVGGWDDKLTDHELDLMCGVYKIFTGEPSACSIPITVMANQPLQPLEPTNRQTLLGGLRVQRGKPVRWMWATGPIRARNGFSGG